ncbi:hypothetical protein NARC_130053 [Candidatus Nitrosocosmicus arcticus]|uniref:Uncharacterized protein n=1 Tax=Candidatus Nitrosocosmicus arcticus TaxID=2035267 RepID=A0A557SSZ1_9ARCH|nr:hypothetical protein NARC_130053 [Candidatus Nitrosocosmicus arcticus]
MKSLTVMKQTNRNLTGFFVGFLVIGLLTMSLTNNLHAKMRMIRSNSWAS